MTQMFLMGLADLAIIPQKRHFSLAVAICFGWSANVVEASSSAEDLLGTWFYALPVSTLGDESIKYKICGKEENYPNNTTVDDSKIIVTAVIPKSSKESPDIWSPGSKIVVVLSLFGTSKSKLEGMKRTYVSTATVVRMEEVFLQDDTTKRKIDQFSSNTRNLLNATANLIEAELHKYYTEDAKNVVTIIKSVGKDRMVEVFEGDEKQEEVVSVRNEQFFVNCLSELP